MNIIKNCKDCELTSDSCGVVCMSDIQPVSEKTAAAPSPIVPAVESQPLSYYIVVINGFYLARFNPVRPYQYDLTSSQSDARKFRTELQLHYLRKFTDYLDSISKPYSVQVWRNCSVKLEQSK